MSIGELACTYACLALHDDGIPGITPEKIATMVKAANVTIESYWPSLFAKFEEKKSIHDLIMNVGSGSGGAAPGAVAAPAAEEKEEEKEESDEGDLGFGLFD